MFGGGRGSPAGFQRWLAPSATYRPPNLIRFLGFDTEPLQQVSLLLRGRPGRGAARRPDPPAQNRRAGYQVENCLLLKLHRDPSRVCRIRISTLGPSPQPESTQAPSPMVPVARRTASESGLSASQQRGEGGHALLPPWPGSPPGSKHIAWDLGANRLPLDQVNDRHQDAGADQSDDERRDQP